MTKELSAKRKVDKCRDTQGLRAVAGVRGAGAADQCGARAAPAAAGIGRPGGARPASPERIGLIELGLSFDFKWGERTVLRAGKNYRWDPIPSVIGIIRYSRGSSNYAAVSLRAAPLHTRRTRPARRGAFAA
ncbi:unnamed protein product [Chrysodeixis includens]|uniref:Uncharacterized protein n=1 Tax=Chrysodeixis includens TaxID=689277 RepID=A0A9N8PXW3_CHRIL|nr:unnamed protein product [Chrysodeixis includens]